MLFTVKIKGQDFKVDAETAEDATDLAEKEAAKGPVTRGVESVGTGLRSAGEGALGITGSGGPMLGGAARWGAQQANKVLPKSLEMDPQGVGQSVTDAADPVFRHLSPLTTIVEALQKMGVLEQEPGAFAATSSPSGVTPRFGASQESRGPTTAERWAAPSVEDVHRATSAVFPQGLQDATTQIPQNRTDEVLQLGGSFLGLGPLGKNGPIGAATRVATPTAAVGGTDVLTDAWEQEGKISPETATAIKTFVGMGAAGLGGLGDVADRALAQRGAAAKAGGSRAAVQAIYDGLVRDGHTPQTARQAMTELGVDANLMDIGENMTQLGIKSATSPGEGQSAIKRELKGREERTGARIRADKEATLGPEVNRDVVMAENKAARKAAGAGYPAAKQNQARPGDLQPIADALDEELATARGAMREPLQRVRDSLDIPGKGHNLDPTASGMHAMREALDQEIARAEKGSPLWGKLNDYRKQLDTELKEAAPDIRALDEEVSGLHKQREAFEGGEGALKKGGQPGTVKSPEEFKATWDAMTEPERRQALSGASRFIDETIGTTDRERSRLKTVIGGEWNEGKLRTMIGDEKADALMKALGREDTFNATLQRVVYNSRTLEGLEQGGKPSLTRGMGDAAIGGFAGGGTTGAVTAASTTGLRNMLARLTSSPEKAEALKSDIGRLLVSKRPDDVFRALEIFANNQPGKSRLPPAALAALLQRQEERGNR